MFFFFSLLIWILESQRSTSVGLLSTRAHVSVSKVTSLNSVSLLSRRTMKRSKSNAQAPLCVTDAVVREMSSGLHTPSFNITIGMKFQHKFGEDTM